MFGVLHLKLTQLLNKIIQLLSCRFSECILHGMLQNDCTHNLVVNVSFLTTNQSS